MPKYEYECPRCGSFSEFRPMAECELPATVQAAEPFTTRVIELPDDMEGNCLGSAWGQGAYKPLLGGVAAIVQVADAAVVGKSQNSARRVDQQAALSWGGRRTRRVPRASLGRKAMLLFRARVGDGNLVPSWSRARVRPVPMSGPGSSAFDRPALWS